MKNLAGKNILVLGLGSSGLAMARWCDHYGAKVTVVDTRPSPPQLPALHAAIPEAKFVNASMNQSLLSEGLFDLVLKSPGLSPASIEVVVAAAQAQGIACNNELGLFCAALADLKIDRGYNPKVVGITGTNGKTTVTSLTGQLLRRSGKEVAVAGNIGPTLLDTLREKLDTATSLDLDVAVLPEIWVLELSSFQLDSFQGFEPTAAVVLNITQDHLDWHGTFPAYVAAKLNIYGASGLMLLNRDDAGVMAAMPQPAKGRALRAYLTFGSDEPRRAGDYGIERVNGMAWLVRAAEADETVKKTRNNASAKLERSSETQRGSGVAATALDVPELYIQRLMPVDALRIRGLHNASNALAALALACAAGGSLAAMLHGLREYRGEPHRVESVAVIHGVEYFDDSKGTNVGATVAALTGLGGERKLVVILGGDGKGQDFSPLAGPVSRYARAAVLIGSDSPAIRAALSSCGVDLLEATSMHQAVELASKHAQAGDAVLMSPACASFDMFDNYEHRAKVFCEAVLALAQEVGAVI